MAAGSGFNCSHFNHRVVFGGSVTVIQQLLDNRYLRQFVSGDKKRRGVQLAVEKAKRNRQQKFFELEHAINKAAT